MGQFPDRVGARTRVTPETGGRASRLPWAGAANGRLERVLGRRSNACSCALLGRCRVLVRRAFCVRGLGRVDGFDDDEAKRECDEGSEVPVRFLATERNALGALELAGEVFDAGAGAIERLREERWSVPGG